MKKIFSFLLVSAAVLAMAACQKEQQGHSRKWSEGGDNAVCA